LTSFLDFLDWNSDDVSKWLASIGLSEYVKKFAKYGVNGKELQSLTPESIERFGVTKLGHRKKLLREVLKLSEQPLRTSSPELTSNTSTSQAM